MINDLLSVMWKERKGLFRVQGRKSQAILTILMPVLLAIYLPWQEGLDWFHNALSFVLAILLPFMIVGISIPDSFAGERERNTLATLLASRLSDRAILFGKITVSVLFAWLVTVAVLLMSAVTVNVLHWDGGVRFFTGTVILADLGLSFFVALLTAGAGVLISLRSSTVQSAQQALMSILMVPLVLIQIAGLVVLQMSGGREQLKEFFVRLQLGEVALILVGGLAMIDLILIAAAWARFQRSRLILA
jgi:ABC-2 type transport system permease protein